MDEDAGTVAVVDLGGPFTLDEVIEIERLSGVSLARWFDGQSPEGELRRAITYVVTRRTNPAASLAQAGQLLMRAD